MTVLKPWNGPILRLAGGQVIVRGDALLDVVRALEAAQHVTRVDGFGPNPRWQWLLEQLRAAAAEPVPTSLAGSEELPQSSHVSVSLEDEIDSRTAAELLGCTARNVRHLHARGVLRSGRLIGGRLLLNRSEVAAEAARRSDSTEGTRQ